MASEGIDCEQVGPAGVPADGGLPCGPRLRGDVVRVVVETGGVVRQCQVEVGDVNVRLVPVDHRDAIRGHAAVSLWLAAGVPPPRVAERAGHSVEVLLRVYAKCLDDGEEIANTRIDALRDA